ncbi:MAG: hypothetical protein KDK78_12500, partial [Chlamydiia bacterium]|nr:hypothetical protein [Chlamydiia bacterium]
LDPSHALKAKFTAACRIALALNILPSKLKMITTSTDPTDKTIVDDLQECLLEGSVTLSWSEESYLRKALNLPLNTYIQPSAAERCHYCWNALCLDPNASARTYEDILREVSINRIQLLQSFNQDIIPLLESIPEKSLLRAWLLEGVSLPSFPVTQCSAYRWYLSTRNERKAMVKDRSGVDADWAFKNALEEVYGMAYAPSTVIKYFQKPVPLLKLTEPSCEKLEQVGAYGVVPSVLAHLQPSLAEENPVLSQYRDSLILALRFLADQLPHLNESDRDQITTTLRATITAWSSTDHTVSAAECADLCKLALMLRKRHLTEAL